MASYVSADGTQVLKKEEETFSAQSSPERETAFPMTGNEAIAQGAWEAGVRMAAAYPGTPSTEILEHLATYPAEDVHAQWSTNEKVACDAAIGASFGGARALAAMKHVGLNVASDALMSQTYIGVNGGLVLAVCDDPGLHSSQNEQDTRLLGQFAMVPVLEPSDAQEALEFTRLAFELSEQFDTPVILRSTTRLCHTRSPVEVGQRKECAPRGFQEDPVKNVMIPAHARRRHPLVLERIRKLTDYFETAEINVWERGSARCGVITMSVAYTYVKEVLPDASILKLGASHPLPEKLIREFARSVDTLFVVEELEPVVERELRAMGLEVVGKEFFPRCGELSPELLREGFVKAGVLEDPGPPPPAIEFEAVARPPVLCAGCPHVTCFMALRALNARIVGDIGCYSLSVIDPLKAMDTTVSMGSSIGNAVGLAKAGVTDKPIVATIGDSTFLHAGIPPLIDAVYNKANITVIVLDNHITAMTGGQDHPGTGRTLRGEPTEQVDYEQLIRAIGVKWVRRVDSYDMGAMYQAFREAIEYEGPSVVISDRPCVVDPIKIRRPPFAVTATGCNACQACMNLGCPAISWADEWYEGRHKVRIDSSQCVGCSLCVQLCPTDCIRPKQP